MRRWLIRIISISLSILAIIVIAGAYLAPDHPDVILQRITEQGIASRHVMAYSSDSLIIGGLSFGDSTKPALLLIHGSPGRWSDWENIITDSIINKSYYIIAVDRPGYGLTSIPPKPDLAAQSAAIWPIINKLKLSNITVVGHSYGGAVAEQLVVDNEKYFKLLFMVAATASPIHMKPRWYNRLASTRLFQYVLPKDLLTSNIEMIGLPQSLQNIETKLAEINTPVIFLQGTDDILVPFGTLEYFKQAKPDGVRYIIPENINHFIPWTDPELIINELKRDLK